MENPIKMDDLGVPLFLETPIWDPQFNMPDIHNLTIYEAIEKPNPMFPRTS